MGKLKIRQARFKAACQSLPIFFSHLNVVVIVGAIVIAHLAHGLILLVAGLAVKLFVHLLQRTKPFAVQHESDDGRQPVQHAAKFHSKKGRKRTTRRACAPQHTCCHPLKGSSIQNPRICGPHFTCTCSLMVSCLTAFSSLLVFISSVSTTSESSFFRSFAASSVNL